MTTDRKEPPREENTRLCVLVSDRDSVVVANPMPKEEAIRLANIIRSCHGEVVIMEETHL